MGKQIVKKERELKGVEGTMQDLIGGSVDIKLPDGGIVIVPSEKSGNRVANMILAAQIRTMIQKSIATYQEKEMLPTPKDLKDLASAARELHVFSSEVYKEDDAPLAELKKVKAPKEAEEVNFDEALETPKNDNPSNP